MNRGDKFWIKPSDGWLGIWEGEVQIVRISKYEDVVEEYADPERIAQDDPSTMKGNWIVYKYTYPTNEDMLEKYCLSEDLFKYHAKKYVEAFITGNGKEKITEIVARAKGYDCNFESFIAYEDGETVYVKEMGEMETIEEAMRSLLGKDLSKEAETVDGIMLTQGDTIRMLDRWFLMAYKVEVENTIVTIFFLEEDNETE